MAEEDKKKTVFITESGNYYYNVMPSVYEMRGPLINV